MNEVIQALTNSFSKQWWNGIAELKARRAELDADIAVIAVPVEYAAEVADKCVEAGIKALWNFTPFHIKTSPEITIENTSIYAHLALMYNRMGQK